MEPSGWCHFNFWSPNRSKTSPPTCLPLLSPSPPSPPHVHGGGGGGRATGRSEAQGGRRDREPVARRHLLLRGAQPAARRAGGRDVSAPPSSPLERAGRRSGDRKSGYRGHGFARKRHGLCRRVRPHLLSACRAQTRSRAGAGGGAMTAGDNSELNRAPV